MPRKLIAITLSQRSGVDSTNGISTSHPALFTRMSIGPSSRSTRSAAAIASSSLVTSRATAIADAPAARISAAACSAESNWISARATFAPSSASREAIARPIPCAAPVTIATLPVEACLIRDASTRDPAAVDNEGRAGGERRFVAGEEQRRLRDFVRAADAAKHRAALDEAAAAVRRGR